MALPWSDFAALPGSADWNFEQLIRSLVQKKWGRYGQLRWRRNQPGVEFHLRLHTDCDLGAAGDWFGWQCKFYELPQSHHLSQTRRDEIENSLDRTKKWEEGITDFVLCLPQLPDKDSVDWFNSLQTDDDPRLHLWAGEDIDAYLNGEAEVLRATYFGEQVLTKEALAEAHVRAVAPVRHRWVPGLNVVTSVEARLRQALLQPSSADALRDQAAELEQLAEELGGSQPDPAVDELLAATLDELKRLSGHLALIAERVDQPHPAAARQLIAERATPAIGRRQLDRLVRALRRTRQPTALAASAVEAEIQHALNLLSDIRGLALARILAVVGDAGRGKSHLAAELTAPADELAAGVFIPGAHLREGETLDALVARQARLAAGTFDELLEACDAAGARQGQQIPVVIDGLNEAQRPEQWRDLLASLAPALDQWENVALILTLRGAVREDVISQDVIELELEWSQLEIRELLARYFEHYRIEAHGARLPMWLFSEPLFVSMFCEAANHERAEPVGIESLPTTMVGVFELYRREMAERLRQRHGHPTLPPGHIQRKLGAVSAQLWEQDARELPYDQVKLLIDESAAEWDHSLYRALEEEGVLFRDDRSGWDDQRAGVLFDLFAGFLIADALLRPMGSDEAQEWLASPELWAKLRSSSEGHPLSDDILLCLIGLVPRKLHSRQLWQFAPEENRNKALINTLDLESDLLDAETLDALAEYIPQHGPPRYGRRHPYDRLWDSLDGPDHRLNARFLDRVLRSMTVAQRDAQWTEWARDRRQDLTRQIEQWRAQWENADIRTETDDLRAMGLAWLLTSSSLPLRDRATRALQRYGRRDPGRLFSLTVRMLDVNDPYVPERLLAASFGAACSHQMPDPGGTFSRALATFLQDLAYAYLEPDARHPSAHQLIRAHVSGCFALTATLHPEALPDGVDAMALAFATPPASQPIPDDPGEDHELDSTLRMDFYNYVVGGLYEHRANYDFGHAGYRDGLAAVRGRIWELGWRADPFRDLDERISDRFESRREEDSPQRTERYGKKYSWIAYYELAGRLWQPPEEGCFDWGRRMGVWPDIDPSFPSEPPPAQITALDWATGGPAEARAWVDEHEVALPDSLFAADQLDGTDGPWLLVSGFLRQENPDAARHVFGFFGGVLVAGDQVRALEETVDGQPYLGNHFLPQAPKDLTTYAGEIPWSSSFALLGGLDQGELDPYFSEVTEDFRQPGIRVEGLAHEYGFSSSRTVLNEASGCEVPSYSLVQTGQLRKLPDSMDLVSLDGRRVSLTRRAPEGWRGALLYVRKDLLAKHAVGRVLVQFAWGERELDFDWQDIPDWYRRVVQDHANIWRRLLVTDLS